MVNASSNLHKRVFVTGTYCKVVNVAKEGIGDTNLFVPSARIHRLVNADNVLGIEPVNKFVARSSSVSAVRAPISSGSVPVS